MALIKCPECGKEVSDKAYECPQCSGILREKEIPKKICSECGEELADEEIICHKCGCPVETELTNSTNHLNIRVKKLVNVKVIASVCIAIVALIVLVFGMKSYNEKKQEKAAEEEKIKISNDYATNLEMISGAMLAGASKAEDAGGLIHDVWYNTVFDESDTTTDKYTRGHSDFNDSLQALFDDSAFQSNISSIKSNQESVKTLMKEMTNPPEEYSEAYDALKDYYNSYLELTNLVIDPKGNLQTYTSNFNDADSAVAKYYQAMTVYFE